MKQLKPYNHFEVEKKWQDFWYQNDLFKTEYDPTKKKYYNLVEFPYPSGAGMHVGHIKAFSALEVISRKRRMEGYNVLFPIGYDAFGLPTENYAIKMNIHPKEITKQNIKSFTNQLKRTGFSFDFSRVIDTTDPNYYKWTQYIFLKLYEKGLAYKSHTYVNFCPNCKVVLANEESQGGKCDRCGSEVVQKEKDVWFLKISEYAEKLLNNLDGLDFLPRIKLEEENWIGKSNGAEIDFDITGSNEKLKIFTTRPDTIFGATFMVVAPEHPILNKIDYKNKDEIENYKSSAKNKTEFERIYMNKEKTGVILEGVKAINPISKKEIPIYVADYVMITYGTGAIMAVPAHDQRDFDFAKKYNIDIIEVISGGDINKEAYTDIIDGTLVNSDFLNGLKVAEAKEKIINYIEENKIGKRKTNYKMKDWAFNRQRYWGEPIPIVYCDACGIVPVPYNELPLVLPDIEKIELTSTGESPLRNVKEFYECKCPKCGKPAHRETDTMPQWAGSSWYFLRYTDPNNNLALADYNKLKYFMPVDWYNGGMEHVTRHLIYSRFWNEFLFDIKEVPYEEPYKKRTAQGLILGSDGEKMSKSKGNVVNPLDIIEEYGADTLRLFIMFLGDYEKPAPWNEFSIKGCRRYLERMYRLFDKVNLDKKGYQKEVLINQTIKKVSEDIEQLKLNTAIAQLMILLNELESLEEVTKDEYLVLLKLTYPFAPHITEELNSHLGNESLVYDTWPTYDENKLVDDKVQLVVQVNGKLRDKILIDANASDEEIKNIALNSEKVKPYLENASIKKIIVVPKKLVSIVL